jgi:putative DNA primase/helicase
MDNEQVTATITKFSKRAGKKASRKNNSGDANVDAEITRLAALSAVQYEHERTATAERLGLRTGILDRLVKAERPDEADGQGRAVSITDEEPWPHPVDGTELANELAKAVRTYVVMPDTTADMVALWALHTWVLDRFTISPRLAATSPTNGCGKTTLLRFLRHVVRRGKRVGSISPAALFRAVEHFNPTVLLDETEKYLELGSDLHALVNEGHCRGATVWRVLGENLELREFAIFGALAYARNGPIPNDLAQRSIVVSLKKRLANEPLSPLSEAQPRPPALEVLARKSARWTQDSAGRLSEIDPGDLINRAGDNWVPLFAIAEVIGNGWPERIRKAAAALAPREQDTLGVMLLADIKAIFDEKGQDRLWSEQIVEVLLAMETRPWAELGKKRKPITKNRLASLLEGFKIAPDSIRIGERTNKGYYRNQFNEAFQRYLTPLGAGETEQRNKADEMSTSAAFKTEHVGSPVPFQKCEKPANDGPCSVVPFQKGGNGVDARVCEHCGAPERPGQPVLDCWVDGDEYLLHRGCQNEWLAASDPDGWSFNSEPHDPAVPADSKVLGVAPGQRCEHCGAGRDVYLIILPGEQEPAPRHKHCAARYWETHSA